ncbi:MAG: alkaline shock response membrane anchor protein AmaP [Candidatus Omnitrophota bacterium]|nr:alkaline shock response membrane anchor protein AmaP [Candidatus Omnitrophota bacterium]
MRLFYTLGVYFYVTALTIFGLLMITLSFHWLEVRDIAAALDFLYNNTYNSRLILALAGILLIILTMFFAQILTGKLQKERTIAWNNPNGQVTIALTAVEDLIKRLTSTVGEIKESRSDVVAGKKGELNIDVRIILRSETNIQELTSNLQEMIKNKIQEILGLEEAITVRVHVAKIIPVDFKDKPLKEDSEFKKPTVPFQSYGR